MGNGYSYSANGDGATDVVLNYFFPFSQKNTIPQKATEWYFVMPKSFICFYF